MEWARRAATSHLLRRSTRAPVGSLQQDGPVQWQTGGSLCPKASAAVADEIRLLAKEGLALSSLSFNSCVHYSHSGKVAATVIISPAAATEICVVDLV